MDSSGRLDGAESAIDERWRTPVAGVVAAVLLLVVGSVLLWGFYDDSGTDGSDQAGAETGSVVTETATTIASIATTSTTVTSSSPPDPTSTATPSSASTPTATATPSSPVTPTATPPPTATPTPTETATPTPNTLGVLSTSDERVYYNVTVTGAIERAPAAEVSDTIVGTTASGSAAQRGWDNFTFTGRITGLTLEGGSARVFVNGEQIDSDELRTNSTPDISIHTDGLPWGYRLVQSGERPIGLQRSFHPSFAIRHR
jgi:hypothetical protein